MRIVLLRVMEASRFCCHCALKQRRETVLALP